MTLTVEVVPDAGYCFCLLEFEASPWATVTYLLSLSLS